MTADGASLGGEAGGRGGGGGKGSSVFGPLLALKSLTVPVSLSVMINLVSWVLVWLSAEKHTLNTVM